MAHENLNILLRYIRHLAKTPANLRSPDQELLERFLDGSESAFEALVRRHGAMVLQVAQRLLNNSHDAEDVFQLREC